MKEGKMFSRLFSLPDFKTSFSSPIRLKILRNIQKSFESDISPQLALERSLACFIISNESRGENVLKHFPSWNRKHAIDREQELAIDFWIVNNSARLAFELHPNLNLPQTLTNAFEYSFDVISESTTLSADSKIAVYKYFMELLEFSESNTADSLKNTTPTMILSRLFGIESCSNFIMITSTSITYDTAMSVIKEGIDNAINIVVERIQEENETKPKNSPPGTGDRQQSNSNSEHHNQWKFDFKTISLDILPNEILRIPGLKPVQIAFVESIGEEMVLLIHSSTIHDAASIETPHLDMKSGLYRTPFGEIIQLVFMLSEEQSKNITAIEMLLDPNQSSHKEIIKNLSQQTHWHFVIHDDFGKIENVFEFGNLENLNEIYAHVNLISAKSDTTAFEKAKDYFQSEIQMETGNE